MFYLKCMAKKKKKEPNKNGVIRDSGGKIVAGSGPLNPKGRPKGTLSLVALLKKKLESVAPNSQKTWAELFIDKMFFTAINDRGDSALMKDIVNRIDGMPKQNIGFGADDTIEKIEIEIVKSRKNNDIQTENNAGVGEELQGVSGQDNQGGAEPRGNGVKQVV